MLVVTGVQVHILTHGGNVVVEPQAQGFSPSPWVYVHIERDGGGPGYDFVFSQAQWAQVVAIAEHGGTVALEAETQTDE